MAQLSPEQQKTEQKQDKGLFSEMLAPLTGPFLSFFNRGAKRTEEVDTHKELGKAALAGALGAALGLGHVAMEAAQDRDSQRKQEQETKKKED